MFRILLPLCFGLVAAEAQTAPARPAFEVASIKPITGCQPGVGRPGMTAAGRIELPCVTLRSLIRSAYTAFTGEALNARFLEIVGGPAWLDTERYQVSAKAQGGASVPQMMGPMLLTLLEDRFKVVVHKEARETDVYVLSVAKGGSRLHAAQDGACVPVNFERTVATPVQRDAPPTCGLGRMNGTAAGFVADWRGVTLAEFAGRMLSSELHRPVVDQTGLAGRFDIRLEYSREAPRGVVTLNGQPVDGGALATSEGMAPSIFTAVQEQLGLKLSTGRAPVEVIVVDQAERPSAN